MLEYRPLAEKIGVEIFDFDVKNANEETFEEIYSIWLEHKLLLFRQQHLTEQDQIAFGEFFGEITERIDQNEVPKRESDDVDPRVILISNIRKNGIPGSIPDGPMAFHIDGSWLENPYKAALLYCLECEGGNTVFSNLEEVYKNLDSELVNQLSVKEILHAFKVAYSNEETTPEVHVLDLPLDELTFYNSHPAITIHPETGKKSLFMSTRSAREFSRMTREESKEALSKLSDLVASPEFCYEHVWTPGDLLIWDNRCTAHARTDFTRAQRRLLRRIAIKNGDAPRA